MGLPSFSVIKLKTKCPLCKLIRHIYPDSLTSDSTSYDIRLSSFLINSSTYGSNSALARDFEAAAKGVSLGIVYQTQNGAGYNPSEKPQFTETGCILKLNNSGITGEDQISPMDLQNTEIDFPQLRAWLAECCESHNSSCAEPPKPEPVAGMQVIDVTTRKMVAATVDFDYAALSYVWGSGNKETTQDSLPNPAPQTIEDAFEVARRLGIPYLWVDRYCIRQDRKDEKHDQISKMHLIYSNARITIIAAAGTGPEHGIPGIGGTSRLPQPHALLDQDLLVAAFPHPTSVIKKSKWASRGWTYQEVALSRRRLAFTEYGAYFECNGTSLSEGIDEPIRQLTTKSPRKLQPRLCGGISAWSSNNIWQHISEFSKRDVSYEEDRINALLGIFGALKKSHLWGLPIHEFSVAAFLKDLMWDTKSPAERNSNFPSWSWTGWRGEIGRREPAVLPVTSESCSAGKVSI